MSFVDLKIGLKASAMTDVRMTTEDIVGSLKHSGEFFIQFFLGEDLEYPVPKFHVNVWDYLTAPEVDRVAAALPRGHAKTTLSKLATVWYLLFTEIRFVVYVSNTLTVAAEACKDIIGYMTSDNFVSVFGEPVFDVERETHGFYKFHLRIVGEDGQIREKYCILRAIGAGQQVRGLNIDNTRPELAVVDDLEDDENTATEALVLKLKKWFYGPFIKAMSKKRYKIIFLGNMLSSRSLLHHFCESSDEWHSLRFGCILSDGTPLWEDMWSLEDIRRDFMEYQKLGLVGRWFAEMMNLPVSDEQALIAAEDIYYAEIVLPGEHDLAFITVDTAISQKTWADETAITVHAMKNGLWRVVDFVKGKYQPDAVFMLIIGYCLKWKTRAVGIEAGGYQIALKFIFDILMVVHQQKFEVIEVPHHNRTKLERIAAWCTMIRKKVWAITEGDYAITEQLLTYDPTRKANKDDLIDACAMGVTMVNFYMPTIVANFGMEAETDNSVTFVNVV